MKEASWKGYVFYDSNSMALWSRQYFENIEKISV